MSRLCYGQDSAPSRPPLGPSAPLHQTEPQDVAAQPGMSPRADLTYRPWGRAATNLESKKSTRGLLDFCCPCAVTEPGCTYLCWQLSQRASLNPQTPVEREGSETAGGLSCPTDHTAGKIRNLAPADPGRCAFLVPPPGLSHGQCGAHPQEGASQSDCSFSSQS